MCDYIFCNSSNVTLLYNSFLKGTTRLSGRPGSNWRPQPWQGCALPTELLPQSVWIRGLLPDETLSLTFVRAYQDTVLRSVDLNHTGVYLPTRLMRPTLHHYRNIKKLTFRNFTCLLVYMYLSVKSQYELSYFS